VLRASRPPHPTTHRNAEEVRPSGELLMKTCALSGAVRLEVKMNDQTLSVTWQWFCSTCGCKGELRNDGEFNGALVARVADAHDRRTYKLPNELGPLTCCTMRGVITDEHRLMLVSTFQPR